MAIWFGFAMGVSLVLLPLMAFWLGAFVFYVPALLGAISAVIVVAELWRDTRSLAHKQPKRD